MSDVTIMTVFVACLLLGWYIEAKHKRTGLAHLAAFVLPVVILIFVEIGAAT